MKNIVKIVFTVCLILGFSGCYNEGSRMIQMNLMMNWFVVFAYLIPLIIASFYQFKVKNSKWYVSILIAILTHIVYAILTLICTALTFDEIVQILY